MVKSGWACILAALFVCSAAAKGDDAAVKKAIQAKYARFARAFMKKDSTAVEKMAAPNFTSKTPDGRTLDAKASTAMLKQAMQMMMPGTKIAIKVTRLSGTGNKVKAFTTSSMSMKVKGQDGKPHLMIATQTSEDTWVKVGGDWKVLETIDKEGGMTLDGKKMDMGAMMGGSAGGAQLRGNPESGKKK